MIFHNERCIVSELIRFYLPQGDTGASYLVQGQWDRYFDFRRLLNLPQVRQRLQETADKYMVPMESLKVDFQWAYDVQQYYPVSSPPLELQTSYVSWQISSLDYNGLDHCRLFLQKRKPWPAYFDGDWCAKMQMINFSECTFATCDRFRKWKDIQLNYH